MTLFSSIPDVMKPFAQAGKVDDIFRPRMLGNGVFATKSGYGVSFRVGGVDPEGFDRATLNYISKRIGVANRTLPEDCQVFEYAVTTRNNELPGRAIANEAVRRQTAERVEFLKANARFKARWLALTLYIPGKVADETKRFAADARSALRRLQNAALVYQQQLGFLGVERLSSDEVVEFYSYLLNLNRSLITHKAAPPGALPKKLGRVHIGLDDEWLRVGKQYCQTLSLVERPRGTRPNLWGEVLAIDCEMVWCSVWQRKAGKTTRKKAVEVENAVGMAGTDIWSATVGGYSPVLPPPKRASAVAQEKQVEHVGDVLVDLDRGQYYGHYSLFGLVHSANKEEVETALPRIHAAMSDPSEAGMLEEKRGAVSAYLSCFPGQPYNVRKLWLRGDHKANLSFAYAPFLGHGYSPDLQDEYTLLYETRQGTPFFFTPFVGGNGNTTVLGGPRRGKSLNTNALFTAAMKYGTKTFIFDQGGSYESNVRALGGSVTHLGLQYPRINFFRQPANKETIFDIAQTIRLMLTKSGVTVDTEDQNAIDRAVERLFEVPLEVRRLYHLPLPVHLKRGLARWVEGGMYGAIFDNVEDDLEFQDLQLFDFGSLDDKHSDLLDVELSWIIRLTQNQIRDKKNLGVPKHIVLDELWKRMGVLPVVNFLLETLKADAKNLAWATLVTQSLEDLGDFGPRIKNACPTTIFLGGAFDRKLYQERFRLNATELEELESLGERELAVKVDGDPVAVGGTGYFKILRMNLDPAAYARATTKPSERALREKWIAELGEEQGMEKLTAAAAGYRGRK